GRGDDGPRCAVPMLDEVAGGPAIRRRSTRHITEAGAGVRRDDDGPPCAVPMFDERMWDGVVEDAAGVVLADGPAVRRRSAGYPREAVEPLRGAGVGRVDD